MNRHEHYDAAEALIERANMLLGGSLDVSVDTAKSVTMSGPVLELAKLSLQFAQTHALLATVPIQ